MNCPQCQGKTYITGTIKISKRLIVRYRHCLKCGTMFQTKEEIMQDTVKESLFGEIVADYSFKLVKRGNKKESKKIK